MVRAIEIVRRKRGKVRSEGVKVKMSEDERLVKTVCGMCGRGCGVDAYFRGNRLVRWEPMPEDKRLGGQCPKWEAMRELQYSPARLTHPLKRVKRGFTSITRDEAFNITASKLAEIKEKYGPESLAIVYGQVFTLTDLMWIIPRFCDAYGTPNFIINSNYCYIPHVVPDYVTFGHHMAPNFESTKCAIFWGSNPFETSPTVNTTNRIKGLKNSGVKFIVIDPRKTNLAKMADIHLQIRPGTDGALALGMMNVIISEDLHDKDFIEKWTLGFDKLAKHIEEYPPKKVAEITWIPENLIIEAARMYATSKPATMDISGGCERHTNTHQSIRAISCLKAITGNVDKPGASVHIDPPPINIRLPGRVTKKAIGQEEFPIFFGECLRKNDQCQNTEALLIDAILSGKIKAVIFIGKEIVLENPNTARTIEALNRLDFMVDIDIVMSETAKLADVVFPAATFLESNRLQIFMLGALGLVTLTRKAVEPLGECISDIDFVLELAHRMGYKEDFPWEDDEALLDFILRQLGTTLDYLKQHPEGYIWQSPQFGTYQKNGFDTESGKAELYSEKLKRHGFDPLPTYVEPAESPISSPEVAKDYPLVLASGAKTGIYVHSQYRYLPRLRNQFPDPLVEINPEDAEEYGISDGDLVEVESLRGRIKVKAAVTGDILKGVVHVYHGWPGESNVNLLIPDKPTDPVSGGPAFRSSLCRVRGLS